MSTPARKAFSSPAARWNYVEVKVLDGERVLHPTHVSFDRLIFADPPGISSQFVEIIVTNNGQSHASHARILPHDYTTVHIPIQLLDHKQKASIKLTA